MHLKSLTILKFKSIKEPVTIEFNSVGKPLTLIGLNGSGKSNILEAVQYFFLNGDYYDLGKNLSNYIAVLELDNNDVKKLEPLIAHDLDGKLLKVTFWHDKPNVKFVECAPLTVTIKTEREKLYELRQRFKETLENYIEKLRHVERRTAYGRQYVSVSNNERLIQPQEFFDWVKACESDINQIDKYCEEFINEDVIQIGKYEMSTHRIYRYPVRKFDFKISFNKADFCPLEKKHINFAAMQKDIDELNLQMAEDIIRLESDWDEILTLYNSIERKFSSALDTKYARDNENQKQSESFLRKLDKALNRKCYLLDNENSLIFGRGKEHLRYGRAYNSFLNLQNPIEGAFYNHCVEIGIIKKSAEKLEFKKYSKTEQDKLRAEFERFINASMPKSAKSQYKRIAVEIADGKEFQLSIIENDNTKIGLNDTSLGRRWLLTYLFMKNNLDVGDFLLVDEPAAFLHPKAQKETLADMEEYAQSGRNVVITTHSPYMISDKMSSYYWVNMTHGQGTKLKRYSLSGFDDARKKLGFLDFSNMVLEGFYTDINKINLYVEGKADAACFEKFFEILKIDKEKYNIISMGSADHADEWYEKRAKVGKADYIFFIDSDMDKEIQGKGFAERKGIPKEKIIFVGGNDCGKLEDLFSETDKKNYFSKGKVDDKKIGAAENFTSKTIAAFEKLFKEAVLK